MSPMKGCGYSGITSGNEKDNPVRLMELINSPGYRQMACESIRTSQETMPQISGAETGNGKKTPYKSPSQKMSTHLNRPTSASLKPLAGRRCRADKARYRLPCHASPAPGTGSAPSFRSSERGPFCHRWEVSSHGFPLRFH